MSLLATYIVKGKMTRAVNQLPLKVSVGSKLFRKNVYLERRCLCSKDVKFRIRDLEVGRNRIQNMEEYNGKY